MKGRQSLPLSKILFVSDTPDDSISHRLPALVKAWDQAGLEEVVTLQTSSSDTWRKSLSSRGIKSTMHVDSTLRLSGILSVARQESVSAIVLDSAQKGPSRASFLHRLINSTTVPLLILDHHRSAEETNDPQGVFDHVVIALDFSPAYDKALSFLLYFRELIQALEIVNVIRHKLTIRDIRHLKDMLSRSRRLWIDKGVDAESHVYAGRTAQEILTAARDYKATVVVLGTHDKLTFFKRMFRRSAVYAVAEQAQVPVLVVP